MKISRCVILVTMASICGLAGGWGVGQLEVRGASYYHRLAFGRALAAIQAGLDRGEAPLVRSVMREAAGDNAHWSRVPAIHQIDAITSGLLSQQSSPKSVNPDQ
jgi:hypothetical protein